MDRPASALLTDAITLVSLDAASLRQENGLLERLDERRREAAAETEHDHPK
jgi:hypothetical protein